MLLPWPKPLYGFPFIQLKWQPTPVFLLGKSHGWSLVGYSPWGCKELDTTERLHFIQLKSKLLTRVCKTAWSTLLMFQPRLYHGTPGGAFIKHQWPGPIQASQITISRGGVLALEKKCSQNLVYIPIGKWLFKILNMLSQVNSLRNKPYIYKNVVFHYSKYWLFLTKKHMKIKVNHSRYPR